MPANNHIKHANGRRAQSASSSPNPPKPPPKKPRRLKRKAGQPSAHSKLNDELQQRICNVVASGQSRERAASLNGINRSTIRDWLLKAQADPNGRYAKFAAALELADDQAIAIMVDRLLKDPDQKWTWKVLKNKRPEEFNERLHIKSELSGPDGSPIPVDMGARFTVVVNCPECEAAVSDAETPDKMRAAAGSNGQ